MIPNLFQMFNLQFTNENPNHRLEYRAYWYGHANTQLREIYVSSYNPVETIYAYDKSNRLDYLMFPNEDIIKYQYDNNGNLKNKKVILQNNNPSGPESLFGISVPTTYGAQNIAYELGTKFQSNVAGQINKIRVYGVSGETGSHIGRIWKGSTLVGGPYTISYTGNNAWVEYTLPTALNINANTQYTVSVSTGTEAAKYYPYSTGELTNAGNNGNNLIYPANAGVYTSVAGDVPTYFNGGFNYFRDVVFTVKTALYKIS